MTSHCKVDTQVMLSDHRNQIYYIVSLGKIILDNNSLSLYYILIERKHLIQLQVSPYYSSLSDTLMPTFKIPLDPTL